MTEIPDTSPLQDADAQASLQLAALKQADRYRRQLVNARRILRNAPDTERRRKLRQSLFSIGAHAGSLIDLAEGELEQASPEYLIDCAAMYAEAGYGGNAYRLLSQARSMDPDILLSHGYVGLIDSIAPFHATLKTQFQAELDLAERYRRHRGRFAQLANAARTVCVVGNSPAIVGEGLGNWIDAHDLVIRFNDFSVGGAYRADYGTKTDIWVHTMRYRDIWRRDGHSFLHTLASGTSCYWRHANGRDSMIVSELAGQTMEEMDGRMFFDLSVRLGAQPSSGLFTLYWLQQIKGTLTGISILGFSQLHDDLSPTSHYFETLNRKKPAPHNWIAERLLLKEITEEQVPSG